jgi:hypothetical protein
MMMLLNSKQHFHYKQYWLNCIHLNYMDFYSPSTKSLWYYIVEYYHQHNMDMVGHSMNEIMQSKQWEIWRVVFVSLFLPNYIFRMYDENKFFFDINIFVFVVIGIFFSWWFNYREYLLYTSRNETQSSL